MSRSAIARLRVLAASREPERCAFCGGALADAHAHLLDAQDGAARCACAACALALGGSARWHRGGARPARLEAAPGDASRWEVLGLPVGLAWFFLDASGRAQARYPGAGGAVRAPGGDAAWQARALEVPAIRALEPGAEAVLVRRDARGLRAWRVPMDRCWHLAGLLRRHWRGLDGGGEARAHLERWLAELERDCA